MSNEDWTYVELELTADERRIIAYHARSQGQQQDDFRYWHPDPIERQRLKERWLQIAEAYEPSSES